MQVSKIQPVLDIESSLCLAYSIQAYSIIYKCSNFFLHFEKKNCPPNRSNGYMLDF